MILSTKIKDKTYGFIISDKETLDMIYKNDKTFNNLERVYKNKYPIPVCGVISDGKVVIFTNLYHHTTQTIKERYYSRYDDWKRDYNEEKDFSMYNLSDLFNKYQNPEYYI